MIEKKIGDNQALAFKIMAEVDQKDGTII